MKTLPLESETFDFTAFDGTIDFGSGTDSQTRTGSDLDEFIGTGSVAFSLKAIGHSMATGAGNLASIFGSRAGATVTVLYTYEEKPDSVTPVPLPATAPLLLGGFGVAALWRRRKS